MRAIQAFLFVCLLVLTGCTTTTPSVQRDPFDRTRPAGCVPLPPTATHDPRPPTETPNPATQRSFPTQVSITLTPFPTPNFIDLSPQVRNEDKMEVRVYRCNGTWAEYLVDPADFPNAIPLAHGDFIYNYAPPISIMGKEPPEPVTPTASQR